MTLSDPSVSVPDAGVKITQHPLTGDFYGYQNSVIIEHPLMMPDSGEVRGISYSEKIGSVLSVSGGRLLLTMSQGRSTLHKR